MQDISDTTKIKEAMPNEQLTFRVLNPLEVENLTVEALDHLITLRDSYTITSEVFEKILVDVSAIFGILDLVSLKELLDFRGIGSNKIIN